MKILNIFAAAGIVIASMGVSVAADAQVRHDNGWRDGDHGRHQGWNRHDRRWNNHHRNCHMEWRHHHKVRVCR
ncbi:MAG: hypothetical protein JWR77_634 [Rhizorhabdus sp.]|nr:hypothetical protein [Rhizorhabdus sp.]